MTKPQHYQQLQYEERIAIASFQVKGLNRPGFHGGPLG